MRQYCPTDEACLLLACRPKTTQDEPPGPWRFPERRPSTFPGLAFRPTPLVSIAQQLRDHAVSHLGALGYRVVAASINLHEILEDPLRPPGSSPDAIPVSTLYLASVELPADAAIPEDWPTLPFLLKSLPNNRVQIPYVRAMQVLAGASDERTSVLETDDISKYFPH